MTALVKNRNGIIGTILFLGALLAILYLFGFSTPLPLPAEQGILVNFGTDESGGGLIEPASTPPQSATPPPVASQETSNDNRQDLLTQENEDAPAVEAKNRIIDKQENKSAREEIEKQREIERKRQEELARQKAEQEQKNAINDMITGAFSKNTSQNSGKEGNDEGEGNKGVKDGITGDSYSGIPSSGGGIPNLAGRNPQMLPKPKYDYQVEGKVVVEITVNRQGQVTKAVPGIKGSNTLDENLLNAAKEAALKSTFDVKLDAEAYQIGTITYYFRLE